MKLYDFWRSSSAWRVRIALYHKGIEFQHVPVDLFAGEHLAEGFHEVNPLTQVPVLELDHEGKRVRVTQSLAIIDLLDQLYPFKRLFPTDPVQRARAIELAEIVNAGIQPLQNRSVLKYVTSIGGDGRAFAERFISRGLTAFEHTAAGTSGRFCVGDELTVADVYLVPELDVARRLDISLDAYPTLLRIEKACTSLKTFAKAHPDKQPGAKR